MGDVAMTVPVLSAFSNAYPTIKLTVLTKKQFAPLFRDLKMVTVISADFNTTHKGVLGLYQTFKTIAKHPYRRRCRLTQCIDEQRF